MKKSFHVAGYSTCKPFQQARKALQGLEAVYPDLYTVTVDEYPSREAYQGAIEGIRTPLGAFNHKTSPIVWYTNLDDSTAPPVFIGGRDDTVAWCKQFFSSLASSSAKISSPVASIPTNSSGICMHIDSWKPGHGFDYDLVVIGGGSGGLACAKEAQRLGANVACLDFVKPSPHGSKWGLGGTCVNVGCIPKKLMHTAALFGEAIHEAKGFGWEYKSAHGVIPASHSWEKLRDNVQDYIKGLNFQYRVSLREKNVTYLNKLGSFRSPYELLCVDAKGKEQIITAARFVIAVGGRPSALDCPGGEYAISSDDLFSLPNAPGKTCVVGAGYVALECAGFLTALNHGKVTVLIRSIPLRGFDRDVVDKVVQHMKFRGTTLVTGVTPVAIEKLPNDKLLVKFSNGDSDIFDTVLAAVGRYADTSGLKLENVTDSDGNKILLNQQNGKIVCNNEQTTVPHVYAIGDVVDSVPELTPSAILAGKYLARRLFEGSQIVMDYETIPTTVFTPLELGTVGMTEDQAIERLGKDNVDCYLSAFTPLEWAMDAFTDGNEESDEEDPNGKNNVKSTCFAKVVVDISTDKVNPKVLGIHIASPNAGEITQGLAIAFRKGLYYDDLINTVGIHPTVAEEFTLLSITKSSGDNTEKADC